MAGMNSTASDGNLGEQNGLPAAIYAVGKLFDIGFEARNLITKVSIGHDRSPGRVCNRWHERGVSSDQSEQTMEGVIRAMRSSLWRQ